ncbi:arylamine N-acetyltransferase family protein [Cellulomonas humilata]|uniref:N-hydroxyarylamine O-acetyltransferase n=1 Tax=Cellulomonas humilata TaxID=144055 RepID=A0ABU0EC00_9CELL|nr:arylamine N-acetyltransferase [Cellulomonas humilata]MDQ0372798.1 N-hydroxyarylamine O-acetyltransferase [Cellulomonas humilata]
MTDPWGVDRLDLDAYLARIGAGPGDPLAAIHRAHLAAIPFENLDVQLGVGVSVDLPDVQAKLVDARRGGYCYEHGILLAAALERLGHTVERRLARIGDPAVVARPRSHLVVVVDGRWLADTGFGSGLLEPVPLVDGSVSHQGAWTFRTVRLDDGSWQLHELHDGAWQTHYTIPPETTYLADVEVANFATSHRPTSRFVLNLVVIRKEEARVRSLIGRRLTVETPTGKVEDRAVGDAELGDVLRDLGLPLSADQVAGLVDR